MKVCPYRKSPLLLGEGKGVVFLSCRLKATAMKPISESLLPSPRRRGNVENPVKGPGEVIIKTSGINPDAMRSFL